MAPKVYIIILNWNGWRDTAACVESCSRLTYRNYDIVILDNGSTDNSEAILRERFPDIVLIQTQSNLGFAGGNNVGIKYALDQGADYVWLLNNDTTVDSAALSSLVEVAEADEKTGMVGSKILYHKDPTVIWYAGAVLDPKKPYRLQHLGLNEEDRGQYDETCVTGYVTGCSLLAGKVMIADIGMLDEDFFLYFEDADWSVRAGTHGWKLMYCPQSVVFHKVSMSTGGLASPLMFYYSARNLLYFVKRHFPEKFISALTFNLFEYVLVNIKKGRFEAAREALKGITDYFLVMVGKKS